jgi:hypothetical protein
VNADYVRGSRHTGVEADHTIIVHPGITSPPSILDTFCAHHANRGVDVRRLDARFSPEGWAEGLAAVGTHFAQSTRLPVFVMGSTRNAAAIQRALEMSDGFFGVILIGDASPSELSEQLTQSLGPNTKPFFCIIGKTDAGSGPVELRAAAAGPLEMHTHRDEVNRLLLSHVTACSDVVMEWSLRQLSNHLNSMWRFTRAPSRVRSSTLKRKVRNAHQPDHS